MQWNDRRRGGIFLMQGSESKATIIKAFSEAWGEFKHPKKNDQNPHLKNKFASLDEVINANKDILKKHNIAVIQEPFGDGEMVTIKTLFFHTSGEWLEIGSLILKPVKNDPQGIGSAITYGRRYTLSAALGIASEEDDDGNHSSKEQPQQVQTRQSQPVQKIEVISGNAMASQISAIKRIAQSKNYPLGEILAPYEKEKLEDLTYEEASEVISDLNKIKKR